MFTMNFSVPEDVKAAFNEAFADQNKSAVVVQLMREAIARAQAQRSAALLQPSCRPYAPRAFTTA